LKNGGGSQGLWRSRREDVKKTRKAAGIDTWRVKARNWISEKGQGAQGDFQKIRTREPNKESRNLSAHGQKTDEVRQDPARIKQYEREFIERRIKEWTLRRGEGRKNQTKKKKGEKLYLA